MAPQGAYTLPSALALPFAWDTDSVLEVRLPRIETHEDKSHCPGYLSRKRSSTGPQRPPGSGSCLGCSPSPDFLLQGKKNKPIFG